MFPPYQVLEKIHHGAVATIHRASGPRGMVAIKHLLPIFAVDREQVAGFEREYEIGSKISHPNLVKYLESGTALESPYLVTEYVHGTTLRDRLAQEESFSTDSVRALLTQLSHGIEALHELGAIHADITPANVFCVDKSEHVKLGDFGVAAEKGQSQSQVKGTYAYMSPEQVQGAPLFPSSDIFSLGTIAWEMLSAKRLFKRKEPFLTLTAVVEDEAPPLPESPISNIILRCLEKSPSARFQSAKDFRSALANSE